MRKIFLSLVLFFLSFSSLAGEDRTFESQRLLLSDNIYSILIKDKLCSSKNECASRQYFFCSPATNGIDVKLYGVTNNRTLEKILNLITKNYLEGKVGRYTFSVFEISKQEDLKLFFWQSPKPIYKVTFERE